MNRSIWITMAGLFLTAPVGAFAQEKSLASTISVYVFPSKGQNSSQQSMDESQCYQWAVHNTGSDPFDLEKQQKASDQQKQADLEAARNAGRGAGARGATGGAVSGALIGEIASDDAGKGAAWGAGLGAIASRRRAKAAQQQATAQSAAKAETRDTGTAEQMENFKKAFSVCLEAKNYLVKY